MFDSSKSLDIFSLFAKDLSFNTYALQKVNQIMYFELWDYTSVFIYLLQHCENLPFQNSLAKGIKQL